MIGEVIAGDADGKGEGGIGGDDIGRSGLRNDGRETFDEEGATGGGGGIAQIGNKDAVDAGVG